MNYKVIITGTTGMVGEGVLIECLAHPQISEVLSVSRRPTGMSHPKLKEYLVPDFLSLQAGDENLKGYDACFYCAGVSSVGMNEENYSRITYDTLLHFAGTLVKINPSMIFCHISGSHTDSSETGRVMWARVKGKAENALMRLPFKRVYNFRPGFMKPTPGQKNIKPLFRFIAGLAPLFRLIFPGRIMTMHEVGLAIINSVLKGYPKQVLEIKDIKELAKS